MGEIIAFFLGLAYIWAGFGFVPFAGTVIAWFILACIGKPKKEWKRNWVEVTARYVIIGISFFAINNYWNNIGATIIAIVLSLVCILAVD